MQQYFLGKFIVEVGEHGCVGCEKACPASNWSATQLKHHRSRGDPLICKTCIVLGRTVRDRNMYACTDCGHKLGRTKYGEKDVDNFNTRGGKLTCIDLSS